MLKALESNYEPTPVLNRALSRGSYEIGGRGKGCPKYGPVACIWNIGMQGFQIRVTELGPMVSTTGGCRSLNAWMPMYARDLCWPAW